MTDWSQKKAAKPRSSGRNANNETTLPSLSHYDFSCDHIPGPFTHGRRIARWGC
jgi:hypothetical protein